jgi:ABC-2 type transport system permease protein
MFAAIKSELRKLVTVRSTYVITAIAIVLIAFFAFYATGWRATPMQLFDQDLLKGQIEQAVLVTGLLGSLVGVLLVTHEYRYNTIMYTLTSSNSRTKTFVAKLVAVTVFSIVFTLLMAILSPLLTVLGINAHGNELVPQTIPLVTIFWKVLFVGWAYSIFAFIFAMIIRVQVGAISMLFLFPAMVESLLAIALRKNAVYLPYNSLQSVLIENGALNKVSVMTAVGWVAMYAVLGLVVAHQLFLRRDAQ